MHSNILIAGAGQLGSRYLQGLAKVPDPLNVYVQDISAESLERANARWKEVKNQDSHHQVFFIQNFDELPGSVDIAIISTSAGVRPEVVEMVANATNVEYWILEKVLAQSEDDIARIGSVVIDSKGAWINTTRRIMKWHQDIKSQISAAGPIILDISGGSWGLASNAVHFLDMLCWWTGERLEHLDTKGLASDWVESKRQGYYEIFGTMVANVSGGSIATISATEEISPHIIRLTDDNFEWTIDETSRFARRSDGLVITGQIEVQSTLTAGLIKDIMETGTCGLPTFDESATLHRVFLKALQEHWNKQPGKPKDSLPIT
jgi:predicted dehydrogenase